MRVLLLGASGLLGHNVLKHLVAEGHEVLAMVRREGSIQLDSTGYKTVVGNPDDRDALAAAAQGCDAIVNCVGNTAMNPLHLHDYEAANVRVAERVVEVMEHHGIKHLVHVSTANTIGHGTATHPADESTPMCPPFDKSLYAQSKLRGEQVVMQAAARHADWHAVVINPGFMLGPMDAKPSSGRMLLAAYRRPLMAAPQGGKAFVDVRDVADAVVSALTRGSHGKRYLAINSHGLLTIKQLYQLQASTMGYRQKVVTLPNALLRLAGLLGDALRQLGIATELSTNNVCQLMAREYYDNRLAVDELGLPERPLEEAIRDFHRWRQENEQRIQNK